MKYGLSKTREAEDMCNYSQYLVQTGREEQKLKDKLDFLMQLEAFHYGDKRIMQLLQIDACQLKYLRGLLLEKRTAVMTD